MAAFRATYSDWKLVRTRQVVQIVFEVPLADADNAYEVLGGMPNSASEQWFGIAAISAEAQSRQIESKRTAWRDLQPQQQAGIRCADPVFEAFIKEQKPDYWRELNDSAECVRAICGVKSRAELGTKHAARVIWHQLDEQFEAWKLMEHA